MTHIKAQMNHLPSERKSLKSVFNKAKTLFYDLFDRYLDFVLDERLSCITVTSTTTSR
jgi:hypothetical protein